MAYSWGIQGSLEVGGKPKVGWVFSRLGGNKVDACYESESDQNLICYSYKMTCRHIPVEQDTDLHHFPTLLDMAATASHHLDWSTPTNGATSDPPDPEMPHTQTPSPFRSCPTGKRQHATTHKQSIASGSTPDTDATSALPSSEAPGTPTPSALEPRPTPE